MYGIETFIGCLHSEKDIALLIDLCQNNLLPRVKRRLNDFERRRIRNGSIFVYEESESKIKRWTDGKIWSPSRCSGLFLIYTESLLESRSRKVMLKKTVTAKLKGNTYHVISYVNLEEELNGMCCLKYGNRLKLIHTQCQKINKAVDDKKIEERGDGCKKRRIMEDAMIDKSKTSNSSVIAEENKENIENVRCKTDTGDCKMETNTKMNVLIDYNKSEVATNETNSFANFAGGIFEMENNSFYTDDEYFYLENPLYKKMNYRCTIDSNEEE